MSSDPTFKSPALRRYLADHTSPREDDFLRELREAATAAGLPEISVSAHQGALLQTLVRLVDAREIVEVGTLGGYSAVWLARGMREVGAQGGPPPRLRTLEVDPTHASFARDWIARSDVRDRVEVLEGDAKESIASIEPTIDVVFVDADKPSYPHYVEHALRILRPGGLLMLDNALAFGNLLDEGCDDPSVLAIRSVNDAVHADPRLEGGICPIGDGFWIMVRG